MEEQVRSGLAMLNRYGVLEGIDACLALDGDRLRHLRRVEGALEAVEALAGKGFLVRWRCWFASLFIGLGRRRAAALAAYFNLPAANKEQLVLAGVEQIEMADLCTACRTDLFFSHRAESGKTGRFGALVILS